MPASATNSRYSALSRALGPRYTQFPRHPVGRLRAVLIGAVVGDMITVFDDHEFDEPLRFARKALGVLPRHHAVELAGHDIQRARDLIRHAGKTQRRRDFARCVLGFAMRARAKRFARE